MLGFKKKEKAVDEYEVKANEIMDKVGVPEKMRKGMINHKKAFKLIAEEMFDNEEPLVYMFAMNEDKDNLGSILLLTEKRIIVETDVPIMKTVETIPLSAITSIENSKYELVIRAGIRSYGFKDGSGNHIKDFAKAVKEKLFC